MSFPKSDVPAEAKWGQCLREEDVLLSQLGDCACIRLVIVYQSVLTRDFLILTLDVETDPSREQAPTFGCSGTIKGSNRVTARHISSSSWPRTPASGTGGAVLVRPHTQNTSTVKILR